MQKRGNSRHNMMNFLGKRNCAIEFYRLALMFGICFLHSIGFGRHPNVFASNVLCSCVVGFVFISGWFGIEFRWWKLVRLYGVGGYAACVFGVLSMAAGTVSTWHGAGILAYNQLIHESWFLHAYAFMMVLAPLVNATVSQRGKVYPLFVMVWIWGFGLTLPFVADLLPRTNGLNAYGGVTLTAIYAGARICRKYAIDSRLSTRTLLMMVPFLMFATGIGLGDYNSPFAFALASSCFLLAMRIPVPARFEKVVVFLGPSMFSVYLIHTNELGFSFIKKFMSVADGYMSAPLSVVATAVVVFVAAAFLDMPRRMIIYFFRKIVLHRDLFLVRDESRFVK